MITKLGGCFEWLDVCRTFAVFKLYNESNDLQLSIATIRPGFWSNLTTEKHCSDFILPMRWIKHSEIIVVMKTILKFMELTSSFNCQTTWHIIYLTFSMRYKLL